MTEDTLTKWQPISRQRRRSPRESTSYISLFQNYEEQKEILSQLYKRREKTKKGNENSNKRQNENTVNNIPIKKKRGRPRKYPRNEVSQESTASSQTTINIANKMNQVTTTDDEKRNENTSSDTTTGTTSTEDSKEKSLQQGL